MRRCPLRPFPRRRCAGFAWMYRGMASPRTVVKMDRASRPVRREYPLAAICRSQALTSSAVMEARARSERRQDVHLDLVAVIAQSCRLQVQSRVPLVDPLGKRDLARARIDIGVGADGGFLVTTVVLGGLTRAEAGSGLQRAVRPPPACAPQVPPFLRVGHRISRSAIRAQLLDQAALRGPLRGRGRSGGDPRSVTRGSAPSRRERVSLPSLHPDGAGACSCIRTMAERWAEVNL